MAFELTAIDHVQLAMPFGGESVAEAFYCGLLGLVRVPKPPVMAARGGSWFEKGNVRIHVGVERDFIPAKKAHPALRIRGFDELLATLRNAGVEIRMSDEIPGTTRCHVDDPFGNRIELIAE